MFHMGSSSFQAGTLTAAAALRQTSQTSARSSGFEHTVMYSTPLSTPV